MSNPITDAIAALAAALNTPETPAQATVPEDLITPAIVAVPAEPFLDDDGAGFGEYNLHVDLWLLVDLVTNEQAADELTDLLTHVLTYLPEGWGIDSIARPGPAQNGQWMAHGMPITVSRYITL